MLMILARLVRSESFWAVVKVRSPHTGPEVSYPRRTRAERRYMVDFNEGEGESAFLVVRSTKGVWFDNPHAVSYTHLRAHETG